MLEIVIWSVAVVVFLISEALTSSLTSIWFAGGAFFALIAKFLGAGVWAQIVVFFTVSILCVIFVKKFYHKNEEENKNPTNSDRLIGQKVLILEDVDNSKNQGTAIVNDVSWKVKSENGEEILKGSTATVLKIEGVKLIVKGE